METLARTLADLSGYQGETRLPVGFDAFWDARAARAAELREVTVDDVGIDSPMAVYLRLGFTSTDGTPLVARYVHPLRPDAETGPRHPAVVMFHDVGCAPHGWHHLTRFAAIGHAVIELENRRWSGDICDGWHGGARDLALARLVDDALVCASIASKLGGVDETRLSFWGEGLGGALAIDAAAVGRVRPSRCAALNPMPADLRSVWLEGPCELLYAGLRAHFRLEDPTGKDADALFSALEYVDTVNFARRLGSRLLVGTSLLDTAAPPSSQFAIVGNVAGEVRHVTYPRWAHERVNAFEDELLAFLHP